MNKRQTAKFNSFFATEILTAANNLVWALLTAFGNAFGVLKTKLGDIEDQLEIQEKIITGYASDKRIKRQSMTDGAMRAKGAVQAYASDQNDMTLYNSVNYAESSILFGRTTASRTKAQIIHDAAEGIIGSLAPYGLLPADQTDYQLKIDAFAGVMSMPKEQRALVASATMQIRKLMKECDSILKTKMDKLMVNFKAIAPSFYNSYFNTRKIDNAPTSFTEIRATVKNKTTQELLEGVEMKAESGVKVYTDTSDVTGTADVKKISPLTYTVTFTMARFVTVVLTNVDLSPGELKKLAVEMMPV